MERKRFLFKTRTQEYHLGGRTLVMGVVNVTPDSFSDGGSYLEPDKAVERALELERQGADIVDIGAESTRPGSNRISEEEEIRRLVPVLKRLRNKIAVPVSVDTYKSGVAARALELGAEMINDPSGLTFDPQLARVVAQADAALALNHMRGTPETWARLSPLRDPLATIGNDLLASIHRARRDGVDGQRIMADPGLGFGKRKEENFRIIAELHRLQKLEVPLLVGPSRKRFLGDTASEDLLPATVAAVTAAVLNGAHMVRVHDVAQAVQAARIADSILSVVPEPEEEEEDEPAPQPPPPPSRRPVRPR
jgi:dihydropteroate synthase